ncbi:ATP-binding domain-containing protein [Caulobacter segnis]|uniref:DNA helicase UvrD n=1 Tax=Caulobacter segnis TaxID=88688 RepID=A0A2W5UT11_9CAUL|nr:ATP-binding domain-containing protein [Caulobacter segnis]PZR30919.1 MAG: DNA helicase UvrD [Caulobacter segnis]
MALGDPTDPTDTERLHAALRPVADQTLAFFEATSAGAARALEQRGSTPSGALIHDNAMTSGAAQRNLASISDDARLNLVRLTQEPAIARIVAMDGDGRRETIFIVRASPQLRQFGGAAAASYRSPIGRLAALDVGEDADVRLGDQVRTWEVIERAELRPVLTAGQWDALRTVFKSLDAGPVTITSLREFLKTFALDDEVLDAFDAQLRADAAARIVVDGRVRDVITKMGLRDRPLLDRYQDEIFREPLGARLAILGPPGTGKTTTLIKRLGLKLDAEHLLDAERQAVSRSVAGLAGLSSSWLMFTPTELLKQYVKEAFNREEIAASDLRIRTWAEQRRELARQRLGILRTSSGRGAIQRDDLANLTAATLADQTGWYADFQGFQAKEFWAELERHAALLAGAEDPETAQLGRRVQLILASVQEGLSAEPFVAIAALREDFARLVTLLRDQLEKTLRRAFSDHMRADPSLPSALLSFLATLDEAADGAEDPDADEDEDEEPPAPKGGLAEAFEAYTRAVRAQARASAQKRSVGRRTRNGRILEWLGERSLDEAQRQTIGQSVLVLAALRGFANPLRRYVERMPARYRRFRRERVAETRWYAAMPFAPTDLSPLEVDLLILAMLSAGRTLLGDIRIAALADEPRFSVLATIRDLLKIQIVVDEATDFSPLQLGCMAQLSDPAVGAFVACGDFNQRITPWGSRTPADLTWVIPDLDLRPIVRSYRHSRQMAALAAKLATDHSHAATLPEDMPNEGFAPVLGRDLSGDSLVAWLAARIGEIDQTLDGGLPSVAVLVNDEADVVPLADALNLALQDANIRCEACPRGLVRGRDSDVRVFDVQHIKGLEFEAVFFVGVDDLARAHPELFDKYLYVGATRAATYLGLTSSGPDLPPALSALEDDFGDDWR